MSLPRGVAGLVRLLVPEEFADDLLADLTEGYDMRREEGRRPRRWLLGELVRTPYVRLRRQSRRMLAAGTRRRMPSRGGGGPGGTLAGLRVAARSLRRQPSFTSVAVLTLTVSIGAATLVFSVLEGVLLRPLPYPDGESLHEVWATNEAWKESEVELFRRSWDRAPLTMDVVAQVRSAGPDVLAAGAYSGVLRRYEDGRPPERIAGAWVAAGFFETLGMMPVVGRLPTPAELDGGEPVMVISERLWNARYGRDPEVIGTAVTTEGVTHTLVGVLPVTFAFPEEASRWWAPFPPMYADGRTDAAYVHAIARLRPGAEPPVVAETLRGLVGRLAESDPTYAGMGVRLAPLRDAVTSPARGGLHMLFWSVVVVVLIACVNLANLMVARGATRRTELALRSALGGGRRALVWAVLSEVTLICAAGGAMGVALATFALSRFVGLLSDSIPGFPRAENVGLNPAVLGFALATTLLTVVLAGLLPALGASRRSPWEALQAGRRGRGGPGTRRTQRTLLLAESGLAVLLLTLAGLLIRSALHVARVDPGFDGQSAAYVEIQPSEDRYPTEADVLALGERLEMALARLPGVDASARSDVLPAIGGSSLTMLRADGAPPEDASLFAVVEVSSSYFQALGIPLVRGRTFGDGDSSDAPAVAVLGELLASRLFGDEDPVGKTVHLGRGTRMEGGTVVSDSSSALTVVGVAADVHQLAVIMDPDPVLYLPLAQMRHRDLYLILRTSTDPDPLLEAAVAEIRTADADLLVIGQDVLSRSMSRLMAPLRIRMLLVVALAVLAAFLTVVGIHGVVAYVVSDQVHEIGVRMALGARSGAESWRMVAEALRPVVAGSLLGLIGAFASARLITSALYGVQPLDPTTYVGVVGLLAAAAAASAWVPARRAASVDPVRVLAADR